MNIVETFSGIGSQTQALQNLGIEHDVVAIAEWDINAMYAYDIMHNGSQENFETDQLSRKELLDFLKQFNLSSNGKDIMSEGYLVSFSDEVLRAIYISISRNNNLVDISSVTADVLPDADILTYSFPCQDLSVGGAWHHNFSGIERDANNRSTLLWEIERILLELNQTNRKLPSFLLMENVNNILSKRHIANFNEWCAFLKDLGYYNKIYTLDASNFGIPQSRKRTFMLSVFTGNNEESERLIKEYFSVNDLEGREIRPCAPMENFLKLNYANKIYRREAAKSTQNYTPSREKIFNDNRILAIGDRVIPGIIAKTVTTKQDRNPNSGIIQYEDKRWAPHNNQVYRTLTARECFLLMGFEEEKFDLLMEHNIPFRKNKMLLTNSNLTKMAGNSIVVPVLEEIFMQVRDIADMLEMDNI